MARANHTPWEPGTVVLLPHEIVQPNPYNGGVFSAGQLLAVWLILDKSCYRLDSQISQLLKH